MENRHVVVHGEDSLLEKREEPACRHFSNDFSKRDQVSLSGDIDEEGAAGDE